MNYLVYLTYGGEDFYNEALYSLLSYYKYHTVDENQVVLYTDNSAFFRRHLPELVCYIDIGEEQIKHWKGSINFIHRVKVKVLQDITQRFSGNFLYLDSDTYFKENIAGLYIKISNGNLVFDRCEGRLIDNPGGIAAKMRKFIKKESSFIIPSFAEAVEIDETFTVWNAGIIGFDSAVAEELFRVEELVDVLYLKNPLFVMEQIAFSYFFQKIKQPVAAESYIHHYWYFKEFRKVLQEFFNYHKDKPFLQLKDELHKIDPQYLSSEKRAYKKMTFWQKQWQKISKGRKWAIGEYTL
ncbi:hypothetical protein CHU92_15400 [Flavobacterium cyanobacteriorum]|uniref:Glycosyl transferase n=1 Tax=Flavobacterium cyanobacteriorum TaxID=2022802 RepID=A0A255YRM5_9FLAO|nr:hypothetical protein [Flavobacterium cyanobacteriorum]OYQ31877.1 hypothetical protein CHU92_15400 [Flavobacterium cyanobacteriorum]